MEKLAELLHAARKEDHSDNEWAVHQAVSMTNRWFFERIVTRYGSWERFMEEHRKSHKREGEE